jgi:hypothetical protein
VTSIAGVNGETGATVGNVTLNTTHTNASVYSSDSWSFTGTANYKDIAATTITDTISPRATVTSVSSSANPSNVGQAVTFTATVTGSGAGAGDPSGVGTVQFAIDGANVGGPVALTGNTAQYSTSTLTAANHVVTTVYSGSTNFTGSPGSLTGGQVVGAVQYTFTGFLAPIDNLPVVNTVKAGSAVPTKWRITSAAGVPISDMASFVGQFSYPIECGTTNGLEAPVETIAPGGSGLEYDGNGYFHINWKTLPSYKAGTCRIMEIRLNDGTTHTAVFKFK